MACRGYSPGPGRHRADGDNPWLERRVIAYAHQGGARRHPRRTLYAIEPALERGADGIELDVHADAPTAISSSATTPPSTGPRTARARSPTMTLEELQASTTPTGSCRARTSTRPRAGAGTRCAGQGAGGPRLRRRHPGGGPRRLPPASSSTSTSSGPHRTWRPTSEALADLLRERGRVDDVIVASFLDCGDGGVQAYAPEIATSPGTFGVAEFYRRRACRRGGARGRAPPRRPPGSGVVQRRDGPRRASSSRPPTARASRCTSGRSTTARRWSTCSTWASTASSPTCRAC